MYRVICGNKVYQTPRANSVWAIVRGRAMKTFTISATVETDGEYITLLNVKNGLAAERSERLSGFSTIRKLADRYERRSQ